MTQGLQFLQLLTTTPPRGPGGGPWLEVRGSPGPNPPPSELSVSTQPTPLLIDNFRNELVRMLPLSVLRLYPYRLEAVELQYAAGIRTGLRWCPSAQWDCD